LYADCLRFGEGVNLDLVTSAKYSKLAADQNHIKAQFFYACCLRLGEGVPIDLVLSAEYCKLAVDQSHPEAQFVYAGSLRFGRGVDHDLLESEKYYKLAADQCFPPAQVAYGTYLLRGEFRFDFVESARHFRFSLGVADQLHTGRNDTHDDSGFPSPLDSTIGWRLYSKAIESRSFSDLNALGNCFECGRHTPKDLPLAAQCYASASLDGDPDGQANYGFCLEYGLGVDRSVSECAEFYGKAADQHHPVGAGHYALCVHFGTGVCEDPESAGDFYEFAGAREPSFLTGNVGRCLRILNISALFPPPTKPETKAAAVAGSPAVLVANPDWMSRHRVAPASWEQYDVIGRGAYGTIICQKERPVKSRHKLVVKRLDPGDTSWEDFKREVENVERIQHPCVIPFFGWSIGASNQYEIHMKLAENENLQKWIEWRLTGRPLEVWTQTLKARIICEIVLGMRYIHSHDIMHRDLKPANILLDEVWHVMISDFGMSRSGLAEGAPTSHTGTPRYAAPEQLETGVSYTKEVDIFSFGLIVSELVEGRANFAQFRSTTAPVLSALYGHVLRHLIPRCCSHRPASRPSFAAILAEFQQSGFAILPGADSEQLTQAVSKVLEWEQHLTTR
jgi:TPR repeat protein